MSQITSDLMPQTISGLLDLRCAQSPDAAAILRRSGAGTGACQATSWVEFRTRSLEVAAALRCAGVTTGSRVAILLGLNPLWELLAHAVYRNRAVVVSLDESASAGAITKIMQDCAATILLTDAARRQKLEHESMIAATVKTVLVDRDPQFSGNDQWLSLESLVAHCNVDTAGAVLSMPAPSDLAVIIYTSGTTGAAKGIAYRHEQVMAACGALVAAYPELGPADRTVCWLPLSAMFQRMANLLAMACGMVTYFVEDPRSVFQQLVEIKPTFFIGVPRFYEKLDAALCSGEPSLLTDSLKHVKLMISGSAPAPVRVLESLQRRDIPVREAYGLSENTVPIAVNRLCDYRFGSVGKPLPPNEVKLADDGEVLVRGPGLFEGYLDDEPLQGLFTASGFYRTGDLGRFDKDGFLFLIGRKRDLIKTSTGRRIAPSKIEAAYARCPWIDQILVVGDGRKYLAAIVTLSGEAWQRLRGGGDAGVPNHCQPADQAVADELLTQWLRVGDPLSPSERIEAFAVLPRPFSADEVTTSQKLRRGLIAQRYAALIDRIYQHSTPSIVFASDRELAMGEDKPSRNAP